MSTLEAKSQILDKFAEIHQDFLAIIDEPPTKHELSIWEWCDVQMDRISFQRLNKNHGVYLICNDVNIMDINNLMKGYKIMKKYMSYAQYYTKSREVEELEEMIVKVEDFVRGWLLDIVNNTSEELINEASKIEKERQ